MRVIQPKGLRGSLKSIQGAIEYCPEVLQPPSFPKITWLSPLAADDYAEYRDTSFLDRLGLASLAPSLKEFWPLRGPQWDALGLAGGCPVLVEAKAHVREFFSPASQASSGSLAQIDRAFALVQGDLGITPASTWSRTYFQYANRLAHLWWLRKQGIDAKLIFVDFLNDDDMGGPKHAETWEAAFAAANYALGIPERHLLRPHIFHVTPNVTELSLAVSH